jgi:site-specific DNA-methyltransferase (adenine-specific)
LIVIDPPYNIGKDKRWDKWKTVEEYVEWMTEVFKECERVLKATGSFYWFHNDMEQVCRLMATLSGKTGLVFKTFITIDKRKVRQYNWKDRDQKELGFWEKGNVYNYYQTDEYLLFYSASDINSYEFKVRKFEKYVSYMNSIKENVGFDLNTLNKEFGYVAGCNWWFNKKQPRLIKEKDYIKLQKNYPEFHLTYYDLLGLVENNENKFNLSKDISTIWEWCSVKNRQHPTQKPIQILERIITHSSNPGDVVLDCFMGSGTSALAAIGLNRDFIGFERESEYVRIANLRLEAIK